MGRCSNDNSAKTESDYRPSRAPSLDWTGIVTGFRWTRGREGVLESEETVDETKRQSERELREVLESQEGVERGEEDERGVREA